MSTPIGVCRTPHNSPTGNACPFKPHEGLHDASDSSLLLRAVHYCERRVYTAFTSDDEADALPTPTATPTVTTTLGQADLKFHSYLPVMRRRIGGRDETGDDVTLGNKVLSLAERPYGGDLSSLLVPIGKETGCMDTNLLIHARAADLFLPHQSSTSCDLKMRGPCPYLPLWDASIYTERNILRCGCCSFQSFDFDV